MNPEKLKTLLVEMEARLTRVEKSITAVDKSFDQKSNVVQRIEALRVVVRRLLSKVDSLRISDIEELERQLGLIRDAAIERLRIDGPDTPLGKILQSLQRDTSLTNLSAGLRIGLVQLGPDDVLRALPGQKTAAFQFEFIGNVLTIIDQPLRPSRQERELAFAALEAAVEQGNFVSRDLESTNASPRLKDGFMRLQAALSGNNNIVQMGSRAQLCNRLIQADADELSQTLFALLAGHIESVFAALAQFEEWRIYCENATAVNIDKEAAVNLAASTRALSLQLRNEKGADGSVSDALETVAAWVEESDAPDKRDILSLTRTLENLWAATVRSVLAVAQETVAAGRKLIAGALLTALLMGAAHSIPIISKIPGGGWVETVYNYFKLAKSDPGK